MSEKPTERNEIIECLPLGWLVPIATARSWPIAAGCDDPGACTTATARLDRHLRQLCIDAGPRVAASNEALLVWCTQGGGFRRLGFSRNRF